MEEQPPDLFQTRSLQGGVGSSIPLLLKDFRTRSEGPGQMAASGET